LSRTCHKARRAQRSRRVPRTAEVCCLSELITVDGNHMIAYTHPDVVAAQIRQAATSAVR